MKQTAVEWLEKEIFKYMQGSNIIDLFNQAKEMEKQQIIDAHVAGHNAPSSTIKHFDAEQYYNEKYNTK
jgi:hypothetical protein